MVGESKMKISISITQNEEEFLKGLVKSGKAASMSHAVRLAIHTLEAAQ